MKESTFDTLIVAMIAFTLWVIAGGAVHTATDTRCKYHLGYPAGGGAEFPDFWNKYCLGDRDPNWRPASPVRITPLSEAMKP